VLLAAALLTVALLLLALVVPGRLAAADWPTRSPVLGLLLWQALGLAGGLLALEIAATVALAPYGSTHGEAIAGLGEGPERWWSLLAGLIGLAVLLRLVQALLTATVRTLRDRRRHRALVDLVATRNPLLRGIDVLGHDLPVAYCLPGLRSRVVVSSGALRRLSGEEVDAVLAHEQAHLDQRHDLVVLPFVALDRTFPVLPAVRTASGEVALLIEMLADDLAARRHDRTVLARALYKVGRGAVPAGGLAAGGPEVLVRASRLLDPPPALTLGPACLAVLASATVLALPLVGILLPVVTG
jgi:Zn-dependent protease with chaperone function